MRLQLSLDSYNGVDGSSLSDMRCSQIVKIYEMLESLGNQQISYGDIQEKADRERLFGQTNAKSAIRTFFPLLKKLDFVNYQAEFPANKCFTNLGVSFVLACRAFETVTDETPNKDLVISKLKNIKSNIQKQGLINMYNNPNYKDHNIWVALRLFKHYRTLHWNAFLYSLYCREHNKTLDEAIEEINQMNEESLAGLQFIKEDGELVKSTSYLYLRSFLEEAALIEKVTPMLSKLTPEADYFFKQIEL